MSIIRIDVRGSVLDVVTPFNTEFVSRAKKLAGKWDADRQTWVFDARDEDRVRDLCMEIYGNNGRVADTCTLRVTYTSDEYASAGPMTLHGRVVARARGRDTGAKLGDGVVVLSGGFTSGGSRINWHTTAGKNGAVVLLRDFPRAMAEALVAEKPGEFAIEPEKAAIDRAALDAERHKLGERLAEIDRLLAQSDMGAGSDIGVDVDVTSSQSPTAP